MRPRPYVGITGFMSRSEVCSALECWFECSRDLMIGALASTSTLLHRPAKQPRRYPRAESIANLFVSSESDGLGGRALNLMHIAPRANTVERYFWIGAAYGAGGPRCHGVQVNGATAEDLTLWFPGNPAPSRLRNVLQIRPGAWTLDEVRKLAPSDLHFFTDVLIDASGGRGVPLDLDVASVYLRAVSEVAPHLGIGVAGGLCAEELPRLAPLVAEFPHLSIDAEGRLRTPEDDLDLGRVREYLAAARELFGVDR